MIALGADAQSVSMLSLLVNIVLSIICFKAPASIERIGLTRKGAVVFAIFNAILWIPLIIAFIFFRTMPLFWFVLFWLVNIVSSLLQDTQGDNWLSSLIPKSIMGRYLGQRSAIYNTFYLVALCMAGYLLDSMNDTIIFGFTIIFVVAFLVAMVNIFFYRSMNDPQSDAVDPGEQKQADFGFFDFLGEIKERKLNTFILFTSLFGITVNICGPLYAFYMLKELNFSYLSFTIVISAEYLARIVSVPFWGRYADRVGNIRILSMVSRVIPFVPICWLFFPHVSYLIVIQIISGVCWGAYDLCTQNYLFKMAPAAKKLRYIVYSRSISLFCMALGGLLSVCLLNEILPVFGSGILSIFLISGVFRGLVVLMMVPKLIDFAVSYGRKKEGIVLDKTILKPLSVKSGLFYRSEFWDKYRGKVQKHSTADLQEIPIINISNTGLYYHSERWVTYSRKTAVVAAERTPNSSIPEISGGIYYNKERWARYKKNSLKEILGEIYPARRFKQSGSSRNVLPKQYNLLSATG